MIPNNDHEEISNLIDSNFNIIDKDKYTKLIINKILN